MGTCRLIGLSSNEDSVLLGFDDTPDPDATRTLFTQALAAARCEPSHRMNHPIATLSTLTWGDRLKDIRCPTLVIHGTDDACLPLPHGQAIQRGIADAKILAVAGMGHLIAPRLPFFAIFVNAVHQHTAH
jgi:pimeloyl-ACP methyl ester carboxylesterase